MTSSKIHTLCLTVLMLLLCPALISSCSQLLDTSPTTDVDKELILKDTESVKVALDGVYATLYNRIDFVTANAHQCFGIMAVNLAAELMGEDMVQTGEGAGWFWKDYNYETRERYTSKIQRCYFTWTYFYQIICNVNYILSAQDSASGPREELDYLMAQAYSLRAYSYFMLIQSFQQTYLGHENLPGVPIYTEPTTSESKGGPRAKVSEVYDRIVEDLDTAMDLYRDSGISQRDITELDYYAANLLRARVALVMGDWQKAATCAGIALEKPGRSLLGIQEATVVKGSFNDADKTWTTGTTPFNSTESSSVLWGAKVLSEQSTVYASFYSQMDACTDIYYAAESPKCISNWLYAQIPESDVRKGWWNGDIGVDASEWKYGANINYNQHKFQWKDQKSYQGDYIFMRLEEAVLIQAEAMCRLKDYSGARKAISELGSRRDPNYQRRVASLSGCEQTFASTGTVSTLLDEILLQRRIELWGEAGRVFDILRLAKGWTRDWTVGGVKSNHTNILSKYPEYAAFPADYLECILMIPQTEIDNNPNINDEDQNPYRQL